MNAIEAWVMLDHCTRLGGGRLCVAGWGIVLFGAWGLWLACWAYGKLSRPAVRRLTVSERIDPS